GPLLDSFVPGSRHHSWVIEQWQRLDPPLLTCESVLSETAFLLHRDGFDSSALIKMVEVGFLKIGLTLQPHLADIHALMRRYRNVPMSLADACLVRLSEINPSAVLLTLDSDFHVYRKHGNKVIPLLCPKA